MPANPVSPAAILLVLTIPGIWLFGRSLALSVLDDLWIGRLTAPGFALAAWLLAVHTSGLLTGSFESALWIGTLGVAFAGHAIHVAATGKRPSLNWIPPRSMWIVAVGGTAAVAPIVLGWAFPDDLFYTGHMSITAAIQNGPYPPANLTFPSLELRYHYGFDLLNAGLTSVVRLPIDAGIDVLTLACWGWVLVFVWAAGDRVFGPGRGWIGAVGFMFAGGMPAFCGLASNGIAEMLVSACSAGGVPVNPPAVAYFFQRPWSVGIPLALTLLFTFMTQPRASRYCLIAVLLIALALTQIVLFAALSAALIVADAWDGNVLSVRQGTLMFGTALVSVAIASQLGGFFASWPGYGDDHLAPRWGVTGSLMASIAWHVASFGFILPLGLVGLMHVPRGRMRTLLICLIFGSLVVINGVEYTLSWDIVKFGFVGLLALTATSSVVTARLVESRRLFIAAGSVVAITVAGVAYVLVMTLRLSGLPGYLTTLPVRLTPDDAAAVEWLRLNLDQRDVVYRSSPISFGYAQWGGLPQVHLDAMAPRLGFPPAMLADRMELLSSMPTEARALVANEVHWVVLGPEDVGLSSLIDGWIANGTAIERGRFGAVRVLHLVNAGTIQPGPRE
jgi:hypothetical protein